MDLLLTCVNQIFYFRFPFFTKWYSHSPTFYVETTALSQSQRSTPLFSEKNSWTGLIILLFPINLLIYPSGGFFVPCNIFHWCNWVTTIPLAWGRAIAALAAAAAGCSRGLEAPALNLFELHTHVVARRKKKYGLIIHNNNKKLCDSNRKKQALPGFSLPLFPFYFWIG